MPAPKTNHKTAANHFGNNPVSGHVAHQPAGHNPSQRLLISRIDNQAGIGYLTQNRTVGHNRNQLHRNQRTDNHAVAVIKLVIRCGIPDFFAPSIINFIIHTDKTDKLAVGVNSQADFPTAATDLNTAVIDNCSVFIHFANSAAVPVIHGSVSINPADGFAVFIQR